MTDTEQTTYEPVALVQATMSFTCPHGAVRKGDVFAADDPITDGRAGAFTAYTPEVRTTSALPSVEQPPTFLPERPKGNDSAAVWAAYVDTLGGDKSLEELEGLKRGELIALADELLDTDDDDEKGDGEDE